jgi:hypothetical protein
MSKLAKMRLAQDLMLLSKLESREVASLFETNISL